MSPERTNIVLEAEYKALADAIAKTLGKTTRSAAVRYALVQTAKLLDIPVPKEAA